MRSLLLVTSILFFACGPQDVELGSRDTATGGRPSDTGGSTSAAGATTVGAGGIPFATGGTTGGTPALGGSAFVEGGTAPAEQLDAGVLVPLSLNAGDEEALEAVTGSMAAVANKTPEQLLDDAKLPFSEGPSYDPLEAAGMDLIQGSPLALNAAEQAVLEDRGFVISDHSRFPSFVYGYELIYAADLPLYVSADSILYAVHQSYDSLLRRIELTSLIPSLRSLLQSMRNRLPTSDFGGLDEQARADVDFYLAVATSLLAGEPQPPVAGADPEEVSAYLQLIESQQGMVYRDLFGVTRIFDFSQFTVRGHYAEGVDLQRYFRAMMWLGRIDFRLIDSTPDGQLFYRRQLEATLALRQLIDETARVNWERIDRTLTAFTGVQDSMSLPEVDELLDDLEIADLADLADLDDSTLAQAIVDGGYGKQVICSHIMLSHPTPGTTMPLNRSFLLFGQRYVADSHVFSNVVWDRVPYDPPTPARPMPDPLDAAYAALANDQAVALLEQELTTYQYAPDLASVRALIDEHPPEYWEGSLYNLWLGSLRALSPTSEVGDPLAVGLPAVAGTEAWGRRILNTQLASWSELRHDTLLYAKQSYTTGQSICEYPDAYVEPYPEFFAALVRFAEHGQQLVGELGLSLTGDVGTYFDNLRTTASILGDMAAAQRSGEPHDPEHIAFINRAVRTIPAGGGCGSPESSADAEGWYADLFLEAGDRVAFDPNIADVHTQPTTVPPDPPRTVGYILHVGTGLARPMVVTTDSCTGPRAYVGLASSYFEQVTEDFARLTDEKWAETVKQGSPADVSWMEDLVVR